MRTLEGPSLCRNCRGLVKLSQAQFRHARPSSAHSRSDNQWPVLHRMNPQTSRFARLLTLLKTFWGVPKNDVPCGRHGTDWMALAPRTSEFLTELEAKIFLRGHCTKDGLFPAIAGNRNPGALGALEIADLQLDCFRAVILGADDMVEQVGAGSTAVQIRQR